MPPAAFSGELYKPTARVRAVGMPSEHEKLKAMADECRKLAAMLEQAEVRSRLLAIAERLEQWAREAHRNGAGQS